MKKIIAILLLMMAILLMGCQKSKEVYTQEYAGRILTINTAEKTITDGEDVYTYTKDYDRIQITFPNGKTYWRKTAVDKAQGSEGGEMISDDPRCIPRSTLISIVNNIEKTTGASGTFNLPVLLMGLLTCGGGIWICRNPEKIWYWQWGWRYKDAEPSDRAITVEFVAGILLIILGVGMIILAF